MAGSVRVSMTVNGAQESADVEPRLLLVHFLRETLGLTGTHVGCDTSNCGACTVHLNGEAVKSCTLLAVQADGAEIKTIEGMGQEGALHPLQEAFWEHHGLQCGYCTPGMIMASADLLQRNPSPTEQEVREALAGNLCRCTGYHNIVKAVLAASETHERHRRRALGRAADQAQGGPAADHGPRALHRRHQRHRAAVGVVRPLARGAREDRLDRHVGRQGATRACTPSSPATTSTSRRRCRWPGCRRGSRSTNPPHWAIAKDEVHHVGDPVALVIGSRPLRGGRRRRAGARRVRPAAGGHRHRDGARGRRRPRARGPRHQQVPRVVARRRRHRGRLRGGRRDRRAPRGQPPHGGRGDRAARRARRLPRRLARRSRRPPRSRTSCGCSWRCSSGSARSASGRSRPRSAAASAPSCRSTARRSRSRGRRASSSGRSSGSRRAREGMHRHPPRARPGRLRADRRHARRQDHRLPHEDPRRTSAPT